MTVFISPVQSYNQSAQLFVTLYHLLMTPSSKTVSKIFTSSMTKEWTSSQVEIHSSRRSVFIVYTWLTTASAYSRTGRSSMIHCYFFWLGWRASAKPRECSCNSSKWSSSLPHYSLLGAAPRSYSLISEHGSLKMTVFKKRPQRYYSTEPEEPIPVETATGKKFAVITDVTRRGTLIL